MPHDRRPKWFQDWLDDEYDETLTEMKSTMDNMESTLTDVHHIVSELDTPYDTNVDNLERKLDDMNDKQEKKLNDIHTLLVQVTKKIRLDIKVDKTKEEIKRFYNWVGNSLNADLWYLDDVLFSARPGSIPSTATHIRFKDGYNTVKKVDLLEGIKFSIKYHNFIIPYKYDTVEDLIDIMNDLFGVDVIKSSGDDIKIPHLKRLKECYRY